MGILKFLPLHGILKHNGIIGDHATQLNNVGTNTHAQVDTHIAATASVHGVGASGFEDKANKGAVNGYQGLDANARIGRSYLPAVLRSGMIGTLAWAEMVVVAGSWTQYNQASQTDWDDLWVTQASFRYNTSVANLDEIKLPSLTLNAGTYEIKVITDKEGGSGILEVLHGTTSIGTSDLYSAVVVYNNVVTFTYSPTTRVSADLRFRSNGKNAGSPTYLIGISRIQIRKTA